MAPLKLPDPGERADTRDMAAEYRRRQPRTMSALERVETIARLRRRGWTWAQWRQGGRPLGERREVRLAPGDAARPVPRGL